MTVLETEENAIKKEGELSWYLDIGYSHGTTRVHRVSHQTLEPPRIQLFMSHTFINNFRGSPTPVSEGEIQELERKHVIDLKMVVGSLLFRPDVAFNT